MENGELRIDKVESLKNRQIFWGAEEECNAGFNRYKKLKVKGKK